MRLEKFSAPVSQRPARGFHAVRDGWGGGLTLTESLKDVYTIGALRLNVQVQALGTYPMRRYNRDCRQHLNIRVASFVFN
jgi:hypothetical protein